MADQITQWLLDAQNPDPNVRNNSETQLNAFRDQDFPRYVYALSTELATPAKPLDARRLAGLLLKNSLDAKEDARKQDYYNRWLNCDAAVKGQIRKQLLDTLQDPAVDAARTAALVIAKVAAIDLPKNMWPELISALLNNMTQTANVGLRHATLEALGYVCEEMAQKPEDVLTPEQVNMILTAVVQGMRKEEASADVRLAATTALSNAVEFAAHNFDNDNERNFIMQVVCDATLAQDVRIRTAAFQCLHQIAGAYYTKLPAYMEDIYKLTLNAIDKDEQEVALQAVEFWSTICDCEIEAEEGVDEDFQSLHFIKQVAGHITPTLLKQLTKQDEDADHDDSTWNLAMASGTCLGLMAKVAGDTMIPLVVPFSTTYIEKSGAPEDWRWREAATFAFGSILDGPQRSQLLPICQQAINVLFKALKDPSEHVRDTTAWTISRMFEFLHLPDEQPPLIQPQLVAPVVNALIESLKDQPHIAYHICCAISHLAAGYHQHEPPATSPLSPFFNDLVASLLQCAAGVAQSVEQAKLQVAAFEAINDLVRAAAMDTLEIVSKLIPVLLEKLRETLQMVVASGQAAEKQAEVQGQLCGTLQVVIQKLSEQDNTKAVVLQYADHIMQALLSVLSQRSSTVHEEAMLAVGAFTYTCGRQFNKYMPQFLPFLKMGLTNHAEWQVCLSTVGVLGDVCRNIEGDILPYCDELITVLMQNLAADHVNRSVKPHILSTFGDIALATEDGFVKYVEAVKALLKQAMTLSVATQQQGGMMEDDILDYNNELRIGIFEAYAGIFNGLSQARCDEAMRGEVPMIVEFLGKVAEDQEALSEDAVLKNAINLLGDICAKVPSAGQVLKQAGTSPTPNALSLLGAAQAPEMAHVMDSVEWAISQVQAAVANS